ncbi:hypothetical protein QBC46DRAFT_419711 [Diplogelasinospora grovesii]|uniref:Uncharacterized protein n=1 Tax=Diplogelasinospora grovesii TaxID=303347 RepID=A0AAN6N0T6_9PEZI|nr:hypothetical protein QBC46DRAFT_419711 [Diplogelasinospora grovesii]
MPYVPTPPADRLRTPSAGELASYQTGPDRFVNLAALSGFRTFRVHGLDLTRFNCFAWTGANKHTTDVMYGFRDCGQHQVGVMHAHRRDNPALDEAPGRGCSSKLAAGPLIAHNQFALCDVREWGARNPQIMYGNIYQCWERDPEVHPTFPGNEENQYPLPGHYPYDPVFARGYGIYPPGHPDNTAGLYNNTGDGNGYGNNYGAAGNNRTAALAHRHGSSEISARR